MFKLLLAAAAAALIAAAVVLVPAAIPLMGAGDSEPSFKGDRLDRVSAETACVDLGWPYTDRCGSVRKVRLIGVDRI